MPSCVLMTCTRPYSCPSRAAIWRLLLSSPLSPLCLCPLLSPVSASALFRLGRQHHGRLMGTLRGDNAKRTHTSSAATFWNAMRKSGSAKSQTRSSFSGAAVLKEPPSCATTQPPAHFEIFPTRSGRADLFQGDSTQRLAQHRLPNATQLCGCSSRVVFPSRLATGLGQKAVRHHGLRMHHLCLRQDKREWNLRLEVVTVHLARIGDRCRHFRAAAWLLEEHAASAEFGEYDWQHVARWARGPELCRTSYADMLHIVDVSETTNLHKLDGCSIRCPSVRVCVQFRWTYENMHQPCKLPTGNQNLQQTYKQLFCTIRRPNIDVIRPKIMFRSYVNTGLHHSSASWSPLSTKLRQYCSWNRAETVLNLRGPWGQFSGSCSAWNVQSKSYVGQIVYSLSLWLFPVTSIVGPSSKQMHGGSNKLSKQHVRDMFN